MLWITIISIILAAASLGILIAQGRQIREICRQMAFLRDNDSNLEITLRLHTPAMKALQKSLNTEMQYFRRMTQESQTHEKHLRQSITDLSHDIRTPLTSLDGYFQLLQVTQDAQKREKYSAVITERIAVLRELLEELFTYARLQDAQEEIPCDRLPVNPVLLHTLLSFRSELHAAGIEPQVEIPETPVRAYCNETALRRVVQNLLKNALMHGSREAAGLRASLEELPDGVKLTIANRCADPDGIDMERVFDRFYRSDAARSRSGTGLGLSIAKGLTECMDGRISGRMEGDWFIAEILLKK